MRHIAITIGLVFLTGASNARAQAALPASPTPSATPTALIRSKSDLDAYLRDTAKMGSPLDALSPHARKRFLELLTFGDSGVMNWNYSDLRAELTKSQIFAILRLIGLQEAAGEVAATAPNPSTRDFGGPDSVQDHFDAFVLIAEPALPSGAGRPARSRRDVAYTNWFEPLQAKSRLAQLPSADIHVLFDAANQACSNSAQEACVDDMNRDLHELDLRHNASDDEYVEVFQALLVAHEFDAALKLRAHHLTPDMAPVPVYRDASSGGNAKPTILTLASDGATLKRESVDLAKRYRIVVVTEPGCHFCEIGIHDIERDRVVSAVFAQHALWMTPPEFVGHFAAIATWNREHPQEQISMAFSHREWHALDAWDLPNFYIFEDGKVAAHIHGWPSEGNLPALRVSLAHAGLLH